MGLSNELVSSFVKAVKSESDKPSETVVYGTIIIDDDGSRGVRIDGSSRTTPFTSTVAVRHNDRVTVMIKDHSAVVTGNLTRTSANADDIDDAKDGIKDAVVSEFDTVIADKIQTDVVDAVKAQIKELEVTDFVAVNAEIESLKTNKAEVVYLEATNAKFDRVSTDILGATFVEVDGEIRATSAKIDDLVAAKGDFRNLETDYLYAEDGTFKLLSADSAVITELTAAKAVVDQLDATKINAAIADVSTLKSDVADIDTLIFGEASGNTIQSNFANAVIAQLGDAKIKSAMIQDISASKITSGDVITNNVRVMSEDGGLVISDNTIQIKEGTNVRVQIGKDASGDYSVVICDANGDVIFSEGGITDKAIKTAIIRNDMISENADISASKLNINSLFAEINDSTETIKSSKIYLDEKEQTLNVAFKSLSSDMYDEGGKVSSQGTQIEMIKGKIGTAIWEQDQSIEGGITELSTKYSGLNETVDGLSSVVGTHTTTINGLTASLEAIKTGSTNLIQNSDFSDGVKSWITSGGGYWTVNVNELDGSGSLELNFSDRTATHWYGATQDISNEKIRQDGKFVLSGWAYVYSDVTPDEDIGVEIKKVYTETNYNESCGVIHLSGESFPRDEWFFFEKVFDLHLEQVDRHYVYFWVGQNGHAKVTRLKLERGDKATDWTLAPEDLAGTVQRVSTAESKIAQNAANIALKVTQTEVETMLGSYSTTEQMDAAIETSAKGITSTVSTTYVTKNEMADVGRNLLRGSAGPFEAFESGGNYGSGTLWDIGKSTYKHGIKLEPGIQYVLSFDYEIIWGDCTPVVPKVSVGIGASAGSFEADITGGTVSYEDHGEYYTTTSDGYPVTGHLEFVFTSPNAETLAEKPYFAMRPGRSTTATVLLGSTLICKNFKLEKGNKATDWSPAPEDASDQLAEAVNDLHLSLSDVQRALNSASRNYTNKAVEGCVPNETYTAFETATNSAIEQLSDNISFTFTETTKGINVVDGKVQSEINKRSKHITFSGDNAISIGGTDSGIVLTVDNDNGIIFSRIVSKSGSEPADATSSSEVQYQLSDSRDVAPTGVWSAELPSNMGVDQYLWIRKTVTYSDAEGTTVGQTITDSVAFGTWNGNDFYTGNIVIRVDERAQFGRLAFIPNRDGSLSFRKVGG